MTLASDSDSQTPIESWRDAQQAALCPAAFRMNEAIQIISAGGGSRLRIGVKLGLPCFLGQLVNGNLDLVGIQNWLGFGSQDWNGVWCGCRRP